MKHTPEKDYTNREGLDRLAFAVLYRAVQDAVAPADKIGPVNKLTAKSWLQHEGKGWAEELGYNLPGEITNG